MPNGDGMRFRRILKGLANLATPVEITSQFEKWEWKNKFLRLAQVKIGRNVAISPGFQCITGLEQHIFIDDYVAIGHNAKLYSFSTIKIGSFTTLAADVSITNGGHDLASLMPSAGEVVIGRGCWIGHGARIVRPVTIGDNAIIGAGAIVTRDVPAGAVVVGAPAKVVKMRELPNQVWFLGNIFFDPKEFTLVKTFP